jgi:hypothetical protein
MLGVVETKEHSMLSRCCLEEYEATMVYGAADDRCWGVLVPLKMVAGYENTLSILEKLVSGRLMIEAAPMKSAATPNVWNCWRYAPEGVRCRFVSVAECFSSS